jgi:hypothetical protein
MKKISRILLNYWKNELHKPAFYLLLAFVSLCIAAEYTFHLKKLWLAPHYFTPCGYYVRSFLFFGIPFVSALLILKSARPGTFSWSPGLLLFLITALISFSLRSSFREHHSLSGFVDENNPLYSHRLLNTIFLGPLMCLLPLLWWLCFDRKKEPLYGFSRRGFELRAYVLLLLLMVPLVAIASTQKDFLAYYPKFAGLLKEADPAFLEKTLLFELFYGLDFIYIEFFFRGFMILALARFIGRDAILATAVFYCTIHFGKPAGETISSFFGGIILGVLALETRSILGGIMVHMGIAWLMELGGLAGRLLSES